MNRTISQFLEQTSAVWAAWMWEMSIQVALLTAIIAGALWLCRKQSASWRYAILLIVLARLVLPPTFAFPTGWGWWLRPAKTEIVEVTETNEALPSANVVDQKIETSTNNVDPKVGASANNVDVAAGSTKTDIDQKIEASGTLIVSETTEHILSHSLLLMIAWICVVATRLGMLITAALQVRVWVRRARPILDGDVLETLASCCEQLNVRRPISIRNSEACTTPLVVGFWRPVILLPSLVMEQLSRDELRAVLTHELHHVRRLDGLLNLVQSVLGTLYFFHPCVWWTNRRLRSLREDACDEMTVASLDRRRPYGSAIVKVAEILGYSAPPLALGVLDGNSSMRDRLARILDPNLPTGGNRLRTVLSVLVLALLLLPTAARTGNALPPSEQKGPIVAELTRRLGSEPTTPTSPEDDDQQPPTSEQEDVPPTSSSDEETPKTTTDSDDVVPPEPQLPPDAEEKQEPPKNRPPTPQVEPPPTPETKQDALAEAAPKIRYKWLAGESYAYAAKIQVECGSVTDSFEGTPIWFVDSAVGDRIVLHYDGLLSRTTIDTEERAQPLRIPLAPPPRMPDLGIESVTPKRHLLTISSLGEITSRQGKSQLPFALGNASEIILDSFPTEPAAAWRTHIKRPIDRSSLAKGSRLGRSFNKRPQPDPNPLFPAGGRGFFGDSPEPAEEEYFTTVHLRQRGAFEIKSVRGDVVTYVRTLQYQPSGYASRKQPSVVARGTTQFDVKRGIPLDVKLQVSVPSHLTSSGNNAIASIHYRLLASSDQQVGDQKSRDE